MKSIKTKVILTVINFIILIIIYLLNGFEFAIMGGFAMLITEIDLGFNFKN